MFQFSEKVEFMLNIGEMCKSFGVTNAVTTNPTFDGRTIEVNGRENIFLGNCGYLGLTMHENLKKAAHEAIDNYGTFFSSSRSFAGLDLNEKLESKWEDVFDRPCIVSPSTTMGHFSTLPTLVSPNDLIIIDKQTHTSVHTAAMVCKGQGTEMSVLPHNRIDHLEAKILDAQGKYENIWFLSDGVYSMCGDLCDAKVSP